MSYASEVLADSPAAYYRCAEASGLIEDSSGNARDATASNGTAQYQQASPIASDPSDYCIYFDGDANFEVPDVGLDLGDTLSLEFWIKRTTTGIAEGIFAKGINAYETQIHTDNKVYLSKTGVLDLANSTATITDTNWHHVVFTKNGTGAGAMKCYIDGTEGTNEIFDDQVLDNSATALHIGSDPFDSSYANSRLDELALYDTVLSQARVEAHYDAAFAVDTGLAWIRA
jgi:hypothetical protein